MKQYVSSFKKYLFQTECPLDWASAFARALIFDDLSFSTVSCMMKHMGLRKKIILWAFVPTAIILMAVATINYVAYRRGRNVDSGARRRSNGWPPVRIATSLAEYADLLITEGAIPYWGRAT
ncbi:MAG: hypothetical protein R2867_34940 [Caldilineaceae bacterium]